MAYSESEVLGKIGNILVEINEEYTSIEQAGQQIDAVQLGLLIAKTKYLTANMEVLGQIITASKPVGNVANELSGIVFTPELEVSDEEADSQSTHEEIVETIAEDISFEKEDFETLEEEAEVSYSTDEVETVQEEVLVEEVIEDITYTNPPVSDRSEEEEVQEIQEFQSNHATSSQSPESDHAVEEQPQSTVSGNVVVNQVVEEQREVVVQQVVQAVEEPAPSRPLTLNELIQQQKKAGLTNVNQFNTSVSQSDRILDLKTAVSLNDKLLFIKDLFNGYSLAYTEAIELLNRFDNFAEADAFLQANYALKNGWASKPQTVEKLYAILRKRFS